MQYLSWCCWHQNQWSWFSESISMRYLISNLKIELGLRVRLSWSFCWFQEPPAEIVKDVARSRTEPKPTKLVVEEEPEKTEVQKTRPLSPYYMWATFSNIFYTSELKLVHLNWWLYIGMLTWSRQALQLPSQVLHLEVQKRNRWSLYKLNQSLNLHQLH